MSQIVAWHCNARDCPRNHSRPDHVCSKPPYLCNRVHPPCETHSKSDHVCANPTGARWKCNARDCPGTHSQPEHVCERPPYVCNRVHPPCGTHSQPAHVCRGDILAFHEDAKRCTNPHQPPDHVVEDCPNCRFEIDIDLRKHADDYRLTPLRIPDYSETGGTTNNQDYARFVIEIEKNDVTALEVEITRLVSGSRTLVYKETLDEKLRRVGQHEWKWDGYDHSGVLDTKVLKDPSLKLELKAQLCGKTKTSVIEFDNEPAEQDWVDVVINRPAKTIDIEVRVELDDGGANGVGEYPPDGAKKTSLFKSLPSSDPRTQKHVRQRSYSDLKNLVHQGMVTYWSRILNNLGNPAANYTVKTRSVESTDKHMDDISVEYNTNGSWMRSSNPGKVRGFYSLFGNFVPERAVYNTGWIEYDMFGGGKVWQHQSTHNEDAEFKHTAAHELGHEILSAYGGDSYSYSHCGTSTVITQTTKDLETVQKLTH